MTDVGKLDPGLAFDNEVLGLPNSLPKLNGSWYLLVYPLAIKAQMKTNSGLSILLPESVAESHNNLLTVGLVVDMGDLAYKAHKYYDPDTESFKPWCKVGDFVVFSRVSYSNAVIHGGRKFYVMPDESVLYVVDDPADVNPMYTFDTDELDKIQAQIKDFQKSKNTAV